jgi:hypothetical protein
LVEYPGRQSDGDAHAGPHVSKTNAFDAIRNREEIPCILKLIEPPFIAHQERCRLHHHPGAGHEHRQAHRKSDRYGGPAGAERYCQPRNFEALRQKLLAGVAPRPTGHRRDGWRNFAIGSEVRVYAHPHKHLDVTGGRIDLCNINGLAIRAPVGEEQNIIAHDGLRRHAIGAKVHHGAFAAGIINIQGSGYLRGVARGIPVDNREEHFAILVNHESPERTRA